MPERIVLTEARMRDLRTPAAGELYVYDTRIPQLVVRLRAGGRPRFYLMARSGGLSRRIPLGESRTWPQVTVDTARDLARQTLADLARGIDPVATRTDQRVAQRAKSAGGRVPMLDALERHLDRLRERGRSGPHVAELERVCKAVHAAGVKDLADPGAATKAARWLKKLDVSDLTRHRYRVHLIAVGKTAVRWWPADVLPREPFLALSGQGAAMPVPPFFTPPEAAQLASDKALDSHDDGGPLWGFLLYTGARFKEATFARWDRLDLDRGTFGVIPPTAEEHAAGARVKRNKSRTVGLQPELVALLREWRRADPRAEFIFPDVWRQQNHRWNVAAFRRHIAALGIPLSGRRIHSLRHTHAVLAIACGEDSLRLRLSMGHAGEAMQAHYASAAMLWRAVLHNWAGTWRLRDPVEIARLSVVGVSPGSEVAS